MVYREDPIARIVNVSWAGGGLDEGRYRDRGTKNNTIGNSGCTLIFDFDFGMGRASRAEHDWRCTFDGIDGENPGGPEFFCPDLLNYKITGRTSGAVFDFTDYTWQIDCNLADTLHAVSGSTLANGYRERHVFCLRSSVAVDIQVSFNMWSGAPAAPSLGFTNNEMCDFERVTG